MPNIIMADPRGQTYETVALPSAITNGENLTSVVNGMGLSGPSIMATTKKEAEVPYQYFTMATINKNGMVANAYRWENGDNVSKNLTATYSFNASAGDTYIIVPCPQT